MDHCKPAPKGRAARSGEARASPASERIPNRERERTRIFARLAVELQAVLDPDRTDRRLIVEAKPGSGPELAEAHILRIGPNVADVEEECDFEAAGDRNAPLGIRDELHRASHAHAVRVQSLARDPPSAGWTTLWR